MRGATPQSVGGLFAAAAEFYRAAPWVALNNGQTFALKIPAKGGAKWIASVMGNGGVEYGLAVYKSWSAFEKTFLGADDPRELMSGHLALFYGGPELLPFSDFEAAQRYGWEVAGPDGVYHAGGGGAGQTAAPAGPGRAALVARRRLRAIPGLVRDQLRPARAGRVPALRHDAEWCQRRPARWQCKPLYPGGTICRWRNRPVNQEDWVNAGRR